MITEFQIIIQYRIIVVQINRGHDEAHLSPCPFRKKWRQITKFPGKIHNLITNIITQGMSMSISRFLGYKWDCPPPVLSAKLNSTLILKVSQKKQKPQRYGKCFGHKLYSLQHRLGYKLQNGINNGINKIKFVLFKNTDIWQNYGPNFGHQSPIIWPILMIFCIMEH